MPKRTRRVVRRVLFPRHTAIIGTTALYTAPLDVRPYAEAWLTGWRGAGLGGTPASVEFTVQHSADLENWTDGEVISPAADAEDTAEAFFDLPWMRVKAAVTGSDPGVTCWLTGEFVLREGPEAGEAP